MKKLLLLTLVLLVSGAMLAQGSKETRVTKSILAFHAGPSFPTGDFSSTDFENVEAGFAKTGFNLNLTYAYQFHKNAGISSSIFYNRYRLNEDKINELFSDVAVDHWKFYGITVGPMLTFDLAKNIAADLRVMGGAANVNSPSAQEHGELILDEEWSWAPVLQGGLNLRFGTGNNIFVFTGLDYQYMKPKFEIEPIVGVIEDRVHQKISVLNLTGGIGIKF